MAFALLAPKPSSHPFHERQLSLKEPVKIGRAVAKAKSANSNGIFDCKVLSRNHAVMWYENGKFLLQDTKSSNGTYVNSVRLSRGSEESEPCQMKSGDILQFGVEVVENSKNVTHGCIIGMVTLFNEDGMEAVSEPEDNPPGLLTLLTSSDQAVLPQELWQLAQFLQDALHREQMLENKLATLQRMIGNCHVASEDTFQGFIQEDKLLSRLETLENQLEIVAKESSEDEMQGEMISYQNERLQYESCAKETLQRILKEKIDALQKCSDLERLLSNSEDEYSYLKSAYDKSQDSFQELLEKNKQEVVDIQILKEELTNSRRNNENIEEQYVNNVNSLKLLLEEAERRGSSAAVEVESLQAECDFTKKQLQAMKERYEQLQEKFATDDFSDDGEMDRSGNDLPFASENATLEKDVKNKSAYIQTLKSQLAAVMSELERERVEVQRLEDSMQLDTFYLPNLNQLKVFQNKLAIMRDTTTSLGDNVLTDELDDLICSTWNDFVDLTNFDSMSTEERSDSFNTALSACNDLITCINGDLENINTTLSIKAVLSEMSESESDENSQILSHQATLVNRRNSKEDIQTLLHQDTVKPGYEDNGNEKMCVQSMQLELGDMSDEQFQIYNKEELGELNDICLEAPDEPVKQINAEQQTEDDEVDTEVQNGMLQEENNAMKIKMNNLQLQYDNLKAEYDMAIEEPRDNENEESRNESEEHYSASISTESLDTDWRINNLHGQLASANQSIEELRQRQNEEGDLQTQKQNQLVNLVMTLFIIMVIFGSLVMLGILQITPGNLPILEETTWTDIWEQLF